MRIIKFRAWHKNTKTMAYDVTPFQRDNNTEVMQYTGLKDKNGKEIYEGDLIKSERHKYPHKIKYTLGAFVGEMVKGKFEGYADGIFFDRFEVIGNIYENPELLKAQNG